MKFRVVDSMGWKSIHKKKRRNPTIENAKYINSKRQFLMYKQHTTSVRTIFSISCFLVPDFPGIISVSSSDSSNLYIGFRSDRTRSLSTKLAIFCNQTKSKNLYTLKFLWCNKNISMTPKTNEQSKYHEWKLKTQKDQPFEQHSIKNKYICISSVSVSM